MNLRIESADMIDREKVETVLRRRFPGADWTQIAAAANAIVGLGDERDEVPQADLRRRDLRTTDNTGRRVFRRSAAAGDRHASKEHDTSPQEPEP
jgi:hypothetical protein